MKKILALSISIVLLCSSFAFADAPNVENMEVNKTNIVSKSDQQIINLLDNGAVINNDSFKAEKIDDNEKMEMVSNLNNIDLDSIELYTIDKKLSNDTYEQRVIASVNPEVSNTGQSNRVFAYSVLGYSSYNFTGGTYFAGQYYGGYVYDRPASSTITSLKGEYYESGFCQKIGKPETTYSYRESANFSASRPSSLQTKNVKSTGYYYDPYGGTTSLYAKFIVAGTCYGNSFSFAVAACKIGTLM